MNIGRILPTEAAAILNVSPQFVRVAMQQGKLPIGTAVQMSSIWTYIVMLTAKGAGELYVESTNEKDGYFVVKGTPKLEFYWEVKTRQKGNRDTRIEQSDITEKEDITAEEQEMLNEQMRNQMMLLYEMEKDEIEVQEEQNRIIERMEESE